MTSLFKIFDLHLLERQCSTFVNVIECEVAFVGNSITRVLT